MKLVYFGIRVIFAVKSSSIAKKIFVKHDRLKKLILIAILKKIMIQVFI